MEYPSLVTSYASHSNGSYGWLAYVTAHEIAHQWWPMQTATDEAAEPWLDEGLAEYTGIRYMTESQRWWSPNAALAFEQSIYAARANLPATLPSWEYTGGAYGIVYSKTALGLWTLEGVVGAERFRRAMALYLADHRFAHPHADDFRTALEGELGELGWLFDDYLHGVGVIDYAAGPIENSGAGSTARIIRKGAVRAPVDILVTFAGGPQQLKAWDGQAADVSLQFPAGRAVVRVEVDPGRKLKAELSRTDNSQGMWRIHMPITRSRHGMVS
jgi:hypothetical protein